MEFGLSSEQTLLQDSLRQFLADQSPLARVRRFADHDEGRATDLLEGLAGMGVPGLLIPEAQGGVGLQALDAAVVAEQLGAHVAPVPFTAGAVMVPKALMLAGSKAQQERWLPQIAAGRQVLGAALAERAGARAVAGAQAGVHAQADGRLSGRALHVLDVHADAWLVADVAGGLYLVEAGAPGLTVRTLETIDRTRPVGELVFENTPADRLPEADAQTCARLLDWGRVMLAADTLGAAQHMLDAAVAYAKQREQFGRVIGSFQAVKHLCAEMAANLEPARAFVWYAAHVLDESPQEAHLAACHLKAHMDEVGRQVAKSATEVHGGMGFTDLLGLHYWFKRIGFNRQMLGAPERLRREAARAQGLIP